MKKIELKRKKENWRETKNGKEKKNASWIDFEMTKEKKNEVDVKEKKKERKSNWTWDLNFYYFKNDKILTIKMRVISPI